MSTMHWSYNGKDYSYKITSEDKLNLARAVEYEGSPQSLVLWTLLQRFALLNAQKYYDNLSDFIKAYVQPINPRWMSSGDLFFNYVKGKNQSLQKKELEKAKKRERKARTTWDELDSNTKYLVERVLSGDRQSPKTNTLHYWASRATNTMSLDEARKHNQKKRPGMELVDSGYGYGPGVNVFFTIPGAEKLSRVQIRKTPLPTGTLVATSLVGFILYIMSKYWS